MKNKTLGLWLIWSLVGYLGFYLLDASDEVVGVVVIINWVFVVIAGLRIMKLSDNK